MNKNILRKIGLTDSELEIYLDIVKHGESLASEIAPRIKISRTYIYDSLQNLISKGLIVYVIKNGRRYFKALEVEKLLEYLDEKKEEIEKQKKDVLDLIKELKVFQKPIREKPIVEIFEGKEGLKTILNDIVKQGKDIVAWGATDRIKNYLPEWFLERYVKEKVKKRIETRQFYVEGEKTLEGPGYILKAVSKEFSNPVTFGAYADRIIIFFWSEIPIIIRVKNKNIANSFRKHFEFLWKKIK
ncbi:MAG: helix-turn-helix domain-containing protein [Candidatus Pacearchaeota archaeon]|nr:MAG: helix-turn-helix domain-containing protein [Candidatus Pacearchaeota archaeon]